MYTVSSPPSETILSQKQQGGISSVDADDGTFTRRRNGRAEHPMMEHPQSTTWDCHSQQSQPTCLPASMHARGQGAGTQRGAETRCAKVYLEDPHNPQDPATTHRLPEARKKFARPNYVLPCLRLRHCTRVPSRFPRPASSPVPPPASHYDVSRTWPCPVPTPSVLV